MKKETEKKVIDNQIEKSNVLKTLLKKNDSLVISNILFLITSVITFFILFFTTFVVKNNMPILGSNPNLISPFYEAFIRNGVAVANLTWFGYIAIFLVLIVLVLGILSLFMTLRKRKSINKQTFIYSLINIPLASGLLVIILIIGLIPFNTDNLISQPLPGNIIKDVFDDISPIWIYYINAPSTLTTFGLVVMIISAILGGFVLILAILPFMLRSIFALNKNKGKMITEAKDKISKMKTADTKETFRDFKKRIKIVNEENEKKSKENLISKNRKAPDNVDLEYLENEVTKSENEQVAPVIITDTNNLDEMETKTIRSSMIDIGNDDDIDDDIGDQVDGFLDEIIGKEK